jgi:uncharacterized membrane protein YidH (DUF202 family)
MKVKSILILLIIIISLIPAWSLNRYLQRIMEPRTSLSRLFFYLLSAMVLVFLYTTLLVLFIKWMFPNA